MEPSLARTIWHHIETVNAVAYFAEECRAGAAAVGLKGFWMGYFGCRAAPLGPVGPGVVEATFCNFHPDRVRRAIPDAWTFASPDRVLGARSAAAAAALRRLTPDDGAGALARATLPVLRAAIDHAEVGGRPLFGANRDVVAPDDPVEALWHAATTLREHRGDGHVALLAGAGLDGCKAHVLFAATEGLEPDLFLASRGWSEDDWRAARVELADRGLLGTDGAATADGRQLRDGIERRTDELAIAPYRPLGEFAVDDLLHALAPAVRHIAASGELRFPNPMGLPRPLP